MENYYSNLVRKGECCFDVYNNKKTFIEYSIGKTYRRKQNNYMNNRRNYIWIYGCILCGMLKT